MVKCIKCGRELGEEQFFCPMCGTPKEISRKSICIKCGSELAEDHVFCSKCGAQQNETKKRICRGYGNKLGDKQEFCSKYEKKIVEKYDRVKYVFKQIFFFCRKKPILLSMIVLCMLGIILIFKFNNLPKEKIEITNEELSAVNQIEDTNSIDNINDDYIDEIDSFALQDYNEEHNSVEDEVDSYALWDYNEEYNSTENNIEDDVTYNSIQEEFTIEEARNAGIEFAILQKNGLVRPIYSYCEYGEVEEPIPVQVKAGDEEQIVAIDSTIATLQRMQFQYVCPVEIVTDDRYSQYEQGTHLFVFKFDRLREMEYRIGAKLNEYDTIKELTNHFKLVNHQDDVEFDNIDGYTGEAALTYIQNNNVYHYRDRGGDLDYYYLPAGRHTFGYYQGTEYIELVFDSTIYIPCGTLDTDKGRQFEKKIECSVDRTRDGYFVVNLPSDNKGTYILSGKYKDEYYIEIL